jgi:hypothetical protein
MRVKLRAAGRPGSRLHGGSPRGARRRAEFCLAACTGGRELKAAVRAKLGASGGAGSGAGGVEQSSVID